MTGFRPWLLAAGSGLLYFAAFPPLDVGVLAFVALVPLLLALRGAGGGRAFLLGWLAGSLGICLLVSGSIYGAAVRYFGEGRLGLIAFALLIPQIHGALYFGVFAWLARGWERRSPLAALALLPAAWVTCELARSSIGWGSPWVLLGHSQHERLWIVQIADLGGVFAISFVVAAVNAALAVVASASAMHTPSPAKRGRDREGALPANRGVDAPPPAPSPAGAGEGVRVAIAVLVLLAAVFLYGRRQVDAWDPRHLPGERVDLVLVQPNLSVLGRASLLAVPANLRVLVDLTRAAGGAADLVVWPENAVGFSLAANPALLRSATAELPRGGHLLLGAPREVAGGDGTVFRNSAFLLDAAGGLVGSYDKLRLTPFAETSPWSGLAALQRRFGAADVYTPGERLELLDLGPDRFAVLICYEAIYADLAGAAARAGAEFLVNISNDDWFGGRAALAQHLYASSFRAIETRRFLARATNSGLTAVIDPRGAPIATTPAAVPAAVSAAVVPIETVTFYSRHGDVFAWGCALLLAVLLGRTRGWGRDRSSG